MKKIAFLLVVILSSLTNLLSQDRPEFPVSRAAQPPKIDGILDDEAWQGPSLPLGEWTSYNPLRGGKSDQRTDVRITYDDRYIYFAFHCLDNEPEKIRTTISRRDNAFNDDWIALSLDSAATGQTAYHLFSNPSGIQMDALNTTASGEQFEADLLWDSAGRITDDGYVVEMRIPLQTIRFSSGPVVRMGILFFRKISRTGVSYSWPAMPPGQWVFDTPAHLIFTDLKQPPLIEVLPSITYAINQTRPAPGSWDPAVDKAAVGLSVKYGITSNVTLDATINPDFSQVESDAFQVQVNQRFPIFYSEKRPFFMEGMGLFNIAGTGGDGNMRTGVHTRRIIDPFWGSKLTGTASKLTFGLLNASDESPASSSGKNKLFNIARVTYALRKADYVGAILTDTEYAGRRNLVVGGDFSIKLTNAQQTSATFLRSQSEGGSAVDTHGAASQLSYSYNSRRISWSNQIEHYDRDFQMDTAFYNRTGFTSGWSYGEMNFYPKEGSDFWIKRVFPFYWIKRGRDQVQDGNEDFIHTGVRFNFTRQGFLNISTQRGHEPWLGRRYRTGADINVNGNAQIVPWLNINGGFNKDHQIYYDAVNPFQGRSTNPNFGLTLQPNEHFSQNIDWSRVRFQRESTGERVFDVTIVNTRTTYQFDKHFLVRLLEQFDSANHRLLTDLLASYEFAPGTVLHAGYGALYERPESPRGSLVPNNLGPVYFTVSRGLFFKASYRHRF